MYQFTTETIINSNKDSNGKLAKFFADGKYFRVTRVGNFNKDCCSKVTRTKYEAPVIEELVTDLSNLKSGATFVPVKDNIYRLTINLYRVDSNRSDYANDLTYNAKQLFYEAKADDTDVDKLIAKFIKCWKYEVTTDDNVYVEISTPSTKKLTIKCTDPYQRIGLATIDLIHTPLNGTAQYTSLTGLDSFETVVNLSKEGTLTKGNVGFGTFFQLVKNHRLPSIDNTYWLAVNREERPVPGGQYNEYQLTSSIVRENMGISAVGMPVTSTTNHIFYVLTSIASDFEAALKAAKFEIVDAVKASGAYDKNGVQVVGVDENLFGGRDKSKDTAGMKQINFTIDNLPKSGEVQIKQENDAYDIFYGQAEGTGKTGTYTTTADGLFTEDNTNVYSVIALPGYPVKVTITDTTTSEIIKVIEYTVA